MSAFDPILWAGTAALVFAALLVGKSIIDYSHPGPQVERAVREHYLLYAIYALFRLALAAYIVCFLTAIPGIVIYAMVLAIADDPPRFMLGVGVCFATIIVHTGYQFCHCLLFEPGTIAANSHYRMSRLYPLWKRLTPGRLVVLRVIWFVVLIVSLAVAVFGSGSVFINASGTATGILLLLYLSMVFGGRFSRLWRRSPPRPAADPGRPNILMIGCDTLRADRVFEGEYHRNLTPNIQRLAQFGTAFTNCIIPLARTAPSLASIFTGCWPAKHGIRTNFSLPQALSEHVPSVVKLLAKDGYRTAVVSDWVGSDMGKFDFGFDSIDVPEDQWNLKYLMRQGPKDIRLFLAIFAHNSIAKRFLPEIYYLPGRPLVDDLGDMAMEKINELAAQEKPFFLNLFVSCSHPPFSVGYPHYLKFADPNYAGESKFSMAKLTDPMEIIRSQSEPREAFDLDQIIDLYDACVARFDLEVGRIVSCLEELSILDNTVIVIYSDHGMEFFENGTWGQGNSALGNHSARIPLVIAHKGSSASNGFMIEDVVRSIDIAPTLLDLAGIEVPAEMDGASLKGFGDGHPQSRIGYHETGVWIAEPANMPEDHLRYPNILELLEVGDRANGTLSIKPEYSKIILAAKDRVLRRDEWFLLRIAGSSGARYHLFDTVHDPKCETDVSAAYPEIFQELCTEMDRFLQVDD